MSTLPSRSAVRQWIWYVAAALLIPSCLTAQRPVSFPTPDGGIVFGEIRGSGDHGVILAHGGGFTKESWRDQAVELSELGFLTLAIDFRGRGESRGGPAPGSADSLHLDVVAAVRYLRERGLTRVSIVGASVGGWATAMAATTLAPGEIDRLVLLAHSPVDEPERLQGEKLFITTRGDFYGSGTLRLPAIREQYQRAPQPKKFVILEGSAHAQHVFETEQGPRLMTEISSFLRRGGS